MLLFLVEKDQDLICLDFLYAVRSDSSQILYINAELVDNELFFLLLLLSRTWLSMSSPIGKIYRKMDSHER